MEENYLYPATGYKGLAKIYDILLVLSQDALRHIICVYSAHCLMYFSSNKLIPYLLNFPTLDTGKSFLLATVSTSNIYPFSTINHSSW